MAGKYSFWIMLFGLCMLADSALAAEKWLPLPPASIAQWYKPHNDRQVWLHTMFSLRREMQAIRGYAAADEPALARNWVERFAEHYLKIAEMVPEWKDELEYGWLERLQSSTATGDSPGITLALRKIEQGCNACHREYRALTALLYRTPDFSAIRIKLADGSEQDYPQAMERLSLLVNRIKIASEDNRPEEALTALQQLRQRLDGLGESCGTCHRDPAPRERFLGQLTHDACGIWSGD